MGCGHRAQNIEAGENSQQVSCIRLYCDHMEVWGSWQILLDLFDDE